MNPSIWHDVVDVITAPYGWVIPVAFLFCVLAAFWRFTGWLWPFGEVRFGSTEPPAFTPTLTDDDQRRVYSAVNRPTLGGRAAKGFTGGAPMREHRATVLPIARRH